MNHSRIANDYRAVAHDELAKADDILDRHDKPRGAAAHHRVAIAHAVLAVDGRLAAQTELLTDMAKMARYQVDRLDEVHLVLDERLGKPTETRVEVHHPTYQPETGGIDLTPTEFTDFLAAAKGEPVDVTEEPPVGSMVVSTFGQVWKRDARGWFRWLMVARLPWSIVRVDAPIHLIEESDDVDPEKFCDDCLAGMESSEHFEKCVDITDDMPVRGAELHRLEDVAEEFGVDLTDTAPDVDPAPRIVCGVCGEQPDSLLGHIGCDASAPDVDPDEALAKALRLTAGRPGFSFPWEVLTQDERDEYLDLARAAREHIEAEEPMGSVVDVGDLYARLDKAEADVERLTRERDEQTRDAIESSGRYRALRAGVVADMDCCPDKHTRQHMREILDRDDERGQK